MQEFHGLRPEDFQKAWPTAYSLAVANVAALQQQAALQMATSTEQVLHSHRAAARAAKLLNESKHDILDEIKNAHAENHQRMIELAKILERAINDLVARETSFQDVIMREKISIDLARAEVATAKAAFRTSPLWRRLWWALHPSSRR